MGQKPIVQALVLAEHVYIDALTGRKVIAGTFNDLPADRFPTTLDRPTYAFVCLTDVRGEVPITLRYSDLRTNQVLLGTKPLLVKSDDPLASHELIVEVPPLPIPHPGTFVFEAYCGNEALGSLRITVNELRSGAT